MTDRDSRQPKWDYYEVPDTGFDIYSWCPTPEPTVPPTQVHLHMPAFAGDRAVIRFKGPTSLDKLITALVDHRKDVWGEPSLEEITGANWGLVNLLPNPNAAPEERSVASDDPDFCIHRYQLREPCEECRKLWRDGAVAFCLRVPPSISSRMSDEALRELVSLVASDAEREVAP